MALEMANEKLKDLDRLRKDQEQILRKINTYHSRLLQSKFSAHFSAHFIFTESKP
jgi:hypothetical protein